MSFKSDGNVVLRGTMTPSTSPVRSDDDEFIVKNAAGGYVAIINLVTGNAVILGTVYQSQPSLLPSVASDDFIVSDPNGSVKAYIDDSGNLYLRGTLTQNGNP